MSARLLLDPSQPLLPLRSIMMTITVRNARRLCWFCIMIGVAIAFDELGYALSLACFYGGVLILDNA